MCIKYRRKKKKQINKRKRRKKKKINMYRQNQNEKTNKTKQSKDISEQIGPMMVVVVE